MATADNPSAIYYNPAGITQLEGHQVRGGAYGLNLQVEYESPSGAKFDNEKNWHLIPQFFYTYRPEKLPVAFGLGFYAPYGLSSKWPQDTGFRTLAVEATLTYFTINPVVAWEITPTLSIGAGVTINYASVDLRQGFLSPAPGFGDTFRINGYGWTVGANAGILWKPHPKLQFGLCYRSPTTVHLDGFTEFKSPVFSDRFDASANLAFPQSIVAGFSFRPTPDWNFEFNVDWTGWDRLNAVVVHQDAPNESGLPTSVELPFHWQSSFYFEFGLTRYIGEHWSVSCGYIFNQNSVPDSNYQPLVFDLDRHFWSAGFGYRGKHFTFDLAYQFGYGPTRTVSGSAASPLGQSADGDYTYFSNAVLVSVGWKF